jgi:site-specific recombinase XerD
VTAPVVPLRAAGDGASAAAEALAAVSRHLDRCKLAARTVRAYKRQSAAYAGWLAAHAADHGDAFTDLVGAEGAVTAWKRDLITARSSPATVNQPLAAVTLMYQQAGLRIAVKRVRIPRPGEPDALTPQQEAALRRAAARRGPRDAAIIAVLLGAGARAEECARLDAGDFAITARTGEVRLHGKGDEVRFVPLSRRARELASAWLDMRGPAWTGQRGPLTISGITQVVRRSRRRSEHTGQVVRDRTVLRQMPGCCVHSRCIRVHDDAAKATKERSDEGRCHHRPVVTLTHSAWSVNRSLPVARAEPTPPRSRPCSDTHPSTQRPGTSAPDQPRTPPSSSAYSTTDQPATSESPRCLSTLRTRGSDRIRRNQDTVCCSRWSAVCEEQVEACGPVL